MFVTERKLLLFYGSLLNPFINPFIGRTGEIDGNVSQTHKSLFYRKPTPITLGVINENTPDIVGFPYIKGKKAFCAVDS